MKDAEIVRHLAEKVMGWKIFDVSVTGFPGFPVLVQKGDFWMYYGSESEMGGRFWNPLEDRDDCAELEAALMAGESGGVEYIYRMEDMAESLAGWTPGIIPIHRFLLTATPRQRSIAMYEATR